MLSFVFILAGKGKSSSPGPSVGAVQQASEDGPEASVADPTAGPSAGAVQQASSVSHVLPGAVHGQLVCVDHLSADDRAKTAPMMSKNGGTCVIGGKEVSITWFLVNWDKSSDTAMLKYVKLNRDAKAKGGHRSVVSAQIWHAKSFNGLEHVLFHGLFSPAAEPISAEIQPPRRICPRTSVGGIPLLDTVRHLHSLCHPGPNRPRLGP